MLLPPPGLLLTVSERGMSLPWTTMRSTVRAVLSLLPPGAEPTTISTFFCGDQACAAAGVAPTASRAPSVIEASNMEVSSVLLFLEVRRLDDLSVFVDFGTDELREKLGRAAHRLEPVVREALADVGAFQRLVHLDVEPRDD